MSAIKYIVLLILGTYVLNDFVGLNIGAAIIVSIGFCIGLFVVKQFLSAKGDEVEKNTALNQPHNCPNCNVPMKHRAFTQSEILDFSDVVGQYNGILFQRGQHGENYKKFFECPKCYETKINNYYKRNW